MAVNEELLQELMRRRDSMPPEKQVIVDEIIRRNSTIPGMEKLGTLPDMPSPSVPEGLKEPEYNFVTSPTGFIRSGMRRAGEGVSALSRPTMDEKMGAASEIIRGLGESAIPAAIGALPYAVMTAPVATGLSVGGGIAGGAGGEGVGHFFGAGPGTSAFLSDVGSILGGSTGAALGGSIGRRLYLGEPRLPSMPSMVSKMAPKEEGVGIHIDPMNPLSWAYYGLRKLSGLRLKEPPPVEAPPLTEAQRDALLAKALADNPVRPVLRDLEGKTPVSPVPMSTAPSLPEWFQALPKPEPPAAPTWEPHPPVRYSPEATAKILQEMAKPQGSPATLGPPVLPEWFKGLPPAAPPPTVPPREALWKSLTGSETPPPDVSAVMPTPTPPAKLPSGRVPGKPPVEGETVPPVAQQTTPQNIPPIGLPKGHVAVAIPPELIDYPEYHQMVLSHGPSQTLRAFESDVPVAQYLKGRGVTPEVWKAANLAERNSMLKGYSEAVKKRHYPMQEVMPKGAVGRTASAKSEHIYNLLNREWGRVGPFIPTGE